MRKTLYLSLLADKIEKNDLKRKENHTQNFILQLGKLHETNTET